MKIAVLTYEDRGSFAVEDVADEDQLLESILEEIGVPFKFEIWSDPKVDWSSYTCILIKSPWDYFDRYVEFQKWCQKIIALGIPVFNDLETVLWNADKWYLKDIQEKGLSIVPTVFVRKGEQPQLGKFFEDFGTDRLIVKPTVSGGAKNTIKMHVASWQKEEEMVLDWMSEGDYMVQPFVEEIENEGEYSYIFFEGKFSHAVLKSPQKGEFRVQHFFGGKIQAIQPNAEELQVVQSYIQNFAANTLYARVDGVWSKGKFLLMELELIEPYLFLFKDAKALVNYKEAIQGFLQKLSQD